MFSGLVQCSALKGLCSKVVLDSQGPGPASSSCRTSGVQLSPCVEDARSIITLCNHQPQWRRSVPPLGLRFRTLKVYKQTLISASSHIIRVRLVTPHCSRSKFDKSRSTLIHTMSDNAARDIVRRYVHKFIPGFQKYLQHCAGTRGHFAQLSWGKQHGGHAGIVYDVVRVLDGRP